MPPPTTTTTTTLLPLTLIVAATSKTNGIGKNGKLPWPMLKQEMGYFKRVTSHIPADNLAKYKNAVIMGKRTWESIPTKFRPLKGRVNVVVSGSMAKEVGVVDAVVKGASDGPIVVGSLDEAVRVLGEAFRRGAGAGAGEGVGIRENYVIGGAMLYEAALKHPNVRRVLLTKIHTDYDCDTFFPLDMDGEEASSRGWKQRSIEELEAATGEEFKRDDQGTQKEENGVHFEFCLYEKDG